MSVVEFKDFKNQLELLSYAEQLTVIEYLIKTLQKKQQSHYSEKEHSDSWLYETFNIMDKHPVFSNGKKWTREELHER